MAEALVVDRDWAEIPYFRKQWFLVFLFLVFMPAYLLVLWTGDTYYRKQAVVCRTGQKRRVTMTLLAAMLMVSFFMRQFH